MFKHIFKNRLRCYFRDRMYVFWLLAFPIILATMFNFSLKRLFDDEAVSTINLAVVEKEDNISSQVCREVFESEESIFEAHYVDVEEAKEMLTDEEVDGYIYFESTQSDTNEIKLVVNKNGINQTILKETLDYISQKIKMISSVYETNQGNVTAEMLEIINETHSFVNEIQITENSPDGLAVFFYSVLAMAAMYGALVGVRVIKDIQANQSRLAARISVAPVSKTKMFLGNITAAYLLQILVMQIVFIYIKHVLDIDFGTRSVYVVLTGIVGAITGVNFGTMIGVIIKKGESTKFGIVVSFTMLCSYFAGMMSNTTKMDVKQSAPIFDRLNPCNLITEAYYKLYYYDELAPYWENIFILLTMIIITLVITIYVLRRQTYDNI